MISYYKQEFIVACPQIAILGTVMPFIFGARESNSELYQNKNYVEDKITCLKKTLEQKGNWKTSLNVEKITTADSLIAQLQENIDKKLIGKSKTRKFKHLIWRLTKQYPIKQDKFDLRKMIKESCYKLDKDYQLQPTFEQKFFAALSYCLNRLPTDIAVQNNNTLRNPKLHFAYPFLLKKCPAIAEKTENQLNCIELTMKHLVKLIKKAKEYKFYVSDWKNNIVRGWNKHRNELIIFAQFQQKNKTENKEIKIQEKILIPPPLQYDIALDLNPSSHPFSFCYGQSNGYCINYENALNIFNPSEDSFGTNNQEKKYFYYILSNPPEKLNYLLEIPETIRKEQNEKTLIKNLDDWLEQNQNSITAQKIKEFIDYKISKLPGFVKKKLENITLKYYSTISLFNSIFYHYPGEDVYIDGIELPLPEVNLEQLQTLTDELKIDDSAVLGGFGGNSEKKWFCWGPKNYGGY